MKHILGYFGYQEVEIPDVVDTMCTSIDLSCDPVKEANALLAALSSSSPCLHAAIAERAKDVEGIAKALYIATEELDSDMGRWASTFDDLEEKGKNMWIKAARAIVRYLEGK